MEFWPAFEQMRPEFGELPKLGCVRPCDCQNRPNVRELVVCCVWFPELAESARALWVSGSLSHSHLARVRQNAEVGPFSAVSLPASAGFARLWVWVWPGAEVGSFWVICLPAYAEGARHRWVLALFPTNLAVVRPSAQAGSFSARVDFVQIRPGLGELLKLGLFRPCLCQTQPVVRELAGSWPDFVQIWPRFGELPKLGRFRPCACQNRPNALKLARLLSRFRTKLVGVRPNAAEWSRASSLDSGRIRTSPRRPPL